MKNPSFVPVIIDVNDNIQPLRRPNTRIYILDNVVFCTKQ
ncbi:hypothetical protein AHF37_12042 [Paragonimus kellicotti]|nr:hypothetical protein AHF37_12042 [Paragonimus kellicotti]